MSLPGLIGQSSTHGLCLLDRPVKPGDDSEMWGASAAPIPAKVKDRSLHLDVGPADDLAPLVDLDLDLRGELLRRIGDGVEAEHLEALLDVGQRHDRLDLAVEEIDDRARGP